MIPIGRTKFKDHGNPPLRRSFWDDVVSKAVCFCPMTSCLVSKNFGQFLFDHAALHSVMLLEGRKEEMQTIEIHAQMQLPALTIRICSFHDRSS